MKTIPSGETLILGAQTASYRDVYLNRLQRLLSLRRQHEEDLNGQGIRLLDRSIFAAYCECRDTGIGLEARQILHQAKFVLDQSANQSDGPSG